jgi:hypothetical protein
VLPRPWDVGERRVDFAENFISFLKALRTWLHGRDRRSAAWSADGLHRACEKLKACNEPREVAFDILTFVTEFFDRALILIVGSGELLGDRGIGIEPAEGEGKASLAGLRLPIEEGSVLGQVVDKGRLFQGTARDRLFSEQLFPAIGPPREEAILLLPVSSFGKTRFLVYADFGDRETSDVPVDLLEILASQGGLVMENALYRKRLQKAGG